MAESKSALPSPASVITPKFDKERCVAHLEKLRLALEKYAGQPNMNPFLWIETNMRPFYKRLAAGDSTLELQNAVLALRSDVLPWVPNFKPSAEQVEKAKKLSVG